MGYRVIYSAILIQCQRVTDRSDGQTDVQLMSITCFSIADARKNCLSTSVGSASSVHDLDGAAVMTDLTS